MRPGVRHGDGEGGRWLAVPWIDGRSVQEVFAPARDGHATDEQRTVMRQTTRAVLAALERLRQTGRVHGDVPAENMIVTGEVVAFIGHGNTHHVDLPLSHAYRGGLIHVIAPEIAAQLLTTADGQHVALTAPADLFALGVSPY
ncbi:hypothetical protein [Streptomyces altiplanensis]